MKSLIVTVLACMSSIVLSAQERVNDSVVIANEDSCSTESIQAAIDACLLLAEAAESNDSIALRKALEAMEKCEMSDFGSLRCMENVKYDSIENKFSNIKACLIGDIFGDMSHDIKKKGSLNGHLVFNAAFADSLANGKDAYNNADNINRSTAHRGQMQSGGILTKTCFIKAKGKSVYTFPSHDRQELAVVAEPGGLITTRVHAVNKSKGINEWHNDTVDVAKGRNSRKKAFNLPSQPRSQVTLEITNCTNKDITVVVISN